MPRLVVNIRPTGTLQLSTVTNTRITSRRSSTTREVHVISFRLILFGLLFVTQIATPLALAMSAPSSNTVRHQRRQRDYTDNFHQCAAAAVDISGAHCVAQNGWLSLQRSVRDWEAGRRQEYLYQIPLYNSQNQAFLPPPALLDSSLHCRLVSPSGKRTLIIQNIQRSGDSKHSKASQAMEIWDGAMLVHRIPLSKQHGKIIANDVTFGTPSWNADETCVVYVAERTPPKTQAYWESNFDSDTLTNDETRVGTQNVLGQGVLEDWGEQYPDQSPLLDLFLVNITTARIGKVHNVPTGKTGESATTNGGVTLGQAVFHPMRPNTITYTGWDAGGLGNMPRRLGLVFCRNRPSAIYTSRIDALLEELARSSSDPDHNSRDQEADFSSYRCLTPGMVLARSPRYVTLANDETVLVCLGNPHGFSSHDGCMGLYRCQDTIFTSPHWTELVSPVTKPSTIGPRVMDLDFPGIFAGQIPPQHCSSDGTGSDFVVLSTQWGSFQRLIRVHLESGRVQLISLKSTIATMNEPHALASHSLLCSVYGSKGSELVVSESASHLPARIWKLSGVFNRANPTGVVEVQATMVAELGSMAATYHSSVASTFELSFDTHLITMAPSEMEGATSEPIQALLLLPQKAQTERVPLVVVPHGGPHSCSLSTYVPGFASLAQEYAVVMPNYRGSTGFGQASLECLLTRIGTVDVEDVMAVTRHVLQDYNVDPKKVAICGGSHGGFLAAHCTSQYPDFFQAAVMRNPVTNIATMVTATDIPDWCHVESLGTYDYSHFKGPTAKELLAMYEKSPVGRLQNVQTPTLVALGLKDLRVPPSQGREWYHALRSRRVDTELLIYPDDNHSLSKVCTEADHWIRIREWFERHLV